MKKIMKNVLPVLYFSFFLMMFSTTTVHAYLDAATTSYIIQIFAGIFIALGTVVGIFWKKIMRFFKNQKIRALEKQISKKAAKRNGEVK